MPGNQEPVRDGARLFEECRLALEVILPFTEPELEFLNILLDKGVIDPSLLTSDGELQERIRQHPMLEWKALHVRQHKAGKVSVGTEGKV